ncbi:hypothetical protein [Pedobacter miscanthi]|uniref:Uncharacterized protein n=1 Tax=Pedobacter miscanthi TaxID=2259170 RepID=A0A366LDT1_9SPHI|nr:hypothetical protein [Pedobacter miscanthi]RBQ12021.1 hypothetical protein DRW42_01830 [Pedobacter miscanthi]
MHQNRTILAKLEASPKFGKISYRTGQAARSLGNKKRQKKTRSANTYRNGFLNHVFNPLINGYPLEISDQLIVEKEFFSSAENLCSFYGLPLMNFPSSVYPENIAQSINDLKQKLDRIDKSLELIVIHDEEHVACVAVKKSFDTKTTLYYLPVEPLYELLQDNKRKKTAELLLSVLAYLYQIGGIPYHAEHGSYLSSIYDMIYDWSSDEGCLEDEKEQQYILDCIELMGEKSKWLLEKLNNKKHLQMLAKRISDFRPSSKAEQELLILAKQAYSLHFDFPDCSVIDRIDTAVFDEDEYYNSSRVYAENYLSFIWSFNDCLYDQLMDTVNSALQEYDEIDEPTTIQFFDTVQLSEVHDHSFEIRFFDVLNRITDNLTDFNDEKYNQ